MNQPSECLTPEQVEQMRAGRPVQAYVFRNYPTIREAWVPSEPSPSPVRRTRRFKRRSSCSR